jgi:hypothetical protein
MDFTSTVTVRPPPIGRVALLWRGDAGAVVPLPSQTRHHLVFKALEALGIAGEPMLYSEEAQEAVRTRLLTVDGVRLGSIRLPRGKTGRNLTRCCARLPPRASG